MAAPVKNLLNPSTITLMWLNTMPLPRMPWRDLEYAPASVWIRSDQDYIVPRWTLIWMYNGENRPVLTSPKPLPLPQILARTNPGRIAQVITFPSVYRSQGSGSTRPSVGQQWPRGVK